MRFAYASIAALTWLSLFCAGCASHGVEKNLENESAASEITSSVDAMAPEGVPMALVSKTVPGDVPSSLAESDNLVAAIPAETPIYSEEESTLSTILDLYDEALEALDSGDYSLAETRIDSAAVLSSGIDIASIGDEYLAQRYMLTLSALFQDYGRLFREVDQINQEEPLNWLGQLSETDSDDFKNGMWTDDELRQIVRKISLRCDVPIEYNDQVKKSIYFFQTVNRQTMASWLRRSGRFLPIIEEIFEEYDLPLDLGYLAMIESGFSAKAYSRAHCSGLWQFSGSTGRLYGLKSSQWYDQRLDPIASTKAAAHHLNDLYKIYGDWLVVMAAYNWGPAGVNRQIKAGNTDFWSMNTPSETRNYVPSFIAAVIISKAPELFGFENIELEAPLAFDTVDVPYTSLETAAACAGIDLDTIQELNTELIKSYTPAEQNYTLRIPVGTKGRFLAEYAKMTDMYQAMEDGIYRVKRGDTLSGIAAQFRVSVSSLAAENGIRNRNNLLAGQRLSIPGHAVLSGNSRSTTASQPVSKTENGVSEKNTLVYVVRRDDNLAAIAAGFKTSVRMIQALNAMGSSTKIVPGLALKIPVGGSDAVSEHASVQLVAAPSSDSGEITYTVQPNDTLYEIGLKYNVSYRDIMSWNNIRNDRAIKPGETIIIKPKG